MSLLDKLKKGDNLEDILSSSDSDDSSEEEEIPTSKDKNVYFDEDFEHEEVIFPRDYDIPNILKGKTKSEKGKLLEKVMVWAYQPIYSESIKGAKLIWKIGYDVKNNKIFIKHGQVDGKLQVEYIDVETNNSDRDRFDQAKLEIDHRYLLKHRSGYRSLNEPKKLEGPMLAYKFADKKKSVHYPVGLTVKLDGIRCLVRMEGDEVVYRSRQNKQYHHLGVLFDESFKLFFKYLPPGIELDGELYGEDLTFERLSSIVRRDVYTDYIDMFNNVRFYLFDSNEKKSYEVRWRNLYNAYTRYADYIKKYYKNLGIKNISELEVDEDGEIISDEEILILDRIVLLRTFWAKSEKEVYKFHRWATSQGYEGTMIRKLFYSNQTPKGFDESIYKEKRRTNILKLKDIYDEEGVIMKVYEGKGREKGLALFKVKDPRGNVIGVRPKGTHERRREMYEKRDSLIGKLITYEYFELTEKNKGRFAIGKEIRDYE